jgi:hypothetical protein
MDGYKSLEAWKFAEQLSLGVLEVTDDPMPRAAVALGSAAEAQRLLVIAARREYLPDPTLRVAVTANR